MQSKYWRVCCPPRRSPGGGRWGAAAWTSEGPGQQRVLKVLGLQQPQVQGQGKVPPVEKQEGPGRVGRCLHCPHLVTIPPLWGGKAAARGDKRGTNPQEPWLWCLLTSASASPPGEGPKLWEAAMLVAACRQVFW